MSWRHIVSLARATLAKHPVLSNTLVYGSLFTLAEVSQQKVASSLAKASHQKVATNLTKVDLHTPHTLDSSSVKRFAIMGVVVAPVFTRWYSWLDKKFPCNSSAVVGKKLLLDQFILTPWIVVLFFVGMAWLEGKKGEGLVTELQEKGLNTFIFDCCFWLPVQVGL